MPTVYHTRGDKDSENKNQDGGQPPPTLGGLGLPPRHVAGAHVPHGVLDRFLFDDTGAFRVGHEERPVELQRREFMVLRRLLENIGHVMSRQQLVENIYGWDSELESNALDVHIHNLRKKFYPELIRTVRGVGYVIDPLPGARQD